MKNVAIPFFPPQNNFKNRFGGKKMKQNTLVLSVLVGILFLLPTTSAMAGIINPDFTEGDDGLYGWTHTDFVFSWFPAGSVQFAPDIDRQQNNSSLSQTFTLDPGSETLSFSGNISGSNETGVFTAALLDPVTGNPLVPSVDGQGHFFTISSDLIPAGNDNLDFTCSIDVSGLSGKNVELAFNLNNDYPIDNLNDSYVVLSNLVVAVPEPATVVLLGLPSLVFVHRKRAAQVN